MANGSRFCEQCGSQLTSATSRYCPSCGAEVGLPVDRQAERREETPQPRRRPPARSRQHQALKPPPSPESDQSRDSGSLRTAKEVFNSTVTPGPTNTPNPTPIPTPTPTWMGFPWPDCGPGITGIKQLGLGPYNLDSRIFSPAPEVDEVYEVSKMYSDQTSEYLNRQEYTMAFREIDRAIETSPDNWEFVRTKMSMYSGLVDQNAPKIAPRKFGDPHPLEEYGRDSQEEFLEVAMEILDGLIAGMPQYCREHSRLPWDYMSVYLWRAQTQMRIYEVSHGKLFHEAINICPLLAPLYADLEKAGGSGTSRGNGLDQLSGIDERIKSVFRVSGSQEEREQCRTNSIIR